MHRPRKQSQRQTLDQHRPDDPRPRHVPVVPLANPDTVKPRYVKGAYVRGPSK